MKLKDLKLRLRALVRPHRVEQELDEELAFHVERETKKLIDDGVTPREARERAQARFGSTALAADADAVAEIVDSHLYMPRDAQPMLITPFIEAAEFQAAANAAAALQKAKVDSDDRWAVMSAVGAGLQTLAKQRGNEAAQAGALALRDLISAAEAQASIAEGLIAAGQLDEASAVAFKIGDEGRRGAVLATLAAKMAEAGRGLEASKTLRTSLELASQGRLTDYTARQALIEATKAAALVSVDDKAKTALLKSYRTAIAYAATYDAAAFGRDERIEVLVPLTAALRVAGATTEAATTAREAFKLSRPQKKFSSSNEFELAQLGATTLVETIDAEEAVRVGATMDPNLHRETGQVTVLTALAHALRISGHTALAAAEAEEALRVANTLDRDQERSSARGEIASEFARLRLYRHSRQTALLCTSSADLLRAYISILRQHAIDRYPTMARFLESSAEKR